jgi:hypothetical protein
MVLLAMILVAVLVGALFIVFGVNPLRQDTKEMNRKLDQLMALSLNPRTRIGQASVQSGAPTEEQELRRLGRASVAKRVVVGGEDSILRTRLQKSTDAAAVDDE